MIRDLEHLSLRIRNGKMELLDQKKLPTLEEWLPCDTIEQMFKYIVELSVRGAPLIGCAAVLSLAIYSQSNPSKNDLIQKTEYLRSSRPTAVNLMNACDKLLQLDIPEEKRDFSSQNICKIAFDIIDKDIDMCDRMGEYGASLIQHGENILHHCNTGSLATMGIGTALGVIRKAHRQGKKIHVYVDETRPLLQGGRLTTYELQKEGIPYTLICDNMAASLMKSGKIQRVLLGADRIAVNGDFANKIGTYNVAIAAKYHGIPFHCVSPVSTLDPECKSGADIEIENRNGKEVRGAFGVEWTPIEANTYNPAFDVTPAELVTSYILDTGIFTNQELDKMFIYQK